MSTFNVTSQEVSDLHNAKCYLRFALERCKELFKDDNQVLKDLQRSMNSLYPVASRLMGEQDAINDRKREMFEDVRKRNGFISIWSIYDIDNLFDMSGLEAEELVYDGWDAKFTTPLPGGNLKWWDLYAAADKLIKQSGDEDHIFIEAFKKDGNKLYLFCGS